MKHKRESMSRNFIVVIDGPMGSGKTTIGDLIHKKLKRTALLSMDKIKWFVSDFKRSRRDNAITNAVLMRMCDEYLNQGIRLIITQGFWEDNKSPFVSPADFKALAKKHKARFHFYQLDASKDVLLRRIQKRKTEARTPIAKTRVFRNIRLWKRNKYSADKIFETDKMSADSITNLIIKEINS